MPMVVTLTPGDSIVVKSGEVVVATLTIHQVRGRKIRVAADAPGCRVSRKPLTKTQGALACEH